MQRFQLPAALDELGGEPVEQLRMAGLFAEAAEVAGRAGEAAAEVVLPDAVDDDAAGQRIVRPGQPAGEDAAAAGGRGAGGDLRQFGVGRVEQRQEAGIDGGFAGAAGLELGDPGRAAGFADDEGGEQGLGLERVEFRELGLGGQELGTFGLLELVPLEVRAHQFGLAPGELDDLLLPHRALLARLAPHGDDLLGEALHGLGLAGGDARSGDALDHGQGFAGGLFPGGVLAVVGLDLGGRGERLVLGPGDVGEEGLQAVVVLLQDGVELVVVALGTLDAQAHEDVGGDAGDLVQDVLPLGLGVALVVFVDRVAQEGRGDGDLRIARIDLVAGDLLAHELVVGLVGVERLDDVVAVGPGVGTVGVQPVALAFGVAGEVEPVLGPALAVARAGEQAVDEAFVGVWAAVGHEGLHLLRRRRQAVQVEVHAAHQFLAAGLGGGAQTVRFELGAHEGVDRLGAAGGGWNLGGAHRLKGPPGPVLGGEFARLAGRLGGGGFGLRPGRAHGDPLLERGDLVFGQLAVGRHLHLAVGVADRLDEQGFVRLVRDHGGAAVAALQEVGQVVDAQLALLLLGGVAVVAGFGQDRADPGLEKLQRLRLKGRSLGAEHQGAGEDEGGR